MRKVAAWLRSHPLTAIFLVLIAFAVATHLFANWRAEVRWQNYCAAARARGVKLTLAEFAPPEIPDAENFAALPMFKAIFLPGAKDPMALPGTPKGKTNFGPPRKGEPFDWQKWQTYFKDTGFIAETTDSPPRDVLRALEHYAPQFKEWSEWKTRPRCRFTLDLKAGIAMPLPHLGMFSNAAKLFSLRLRSHLALGDSSAAYMDFREGLQAHRALNKEPTLLAGLMQMSALATLFSAVGDGLANHTWAEPELRKIETDLAAICMWHGYRQSFSSECAFANSMYDRLSSLPPWLRAREVIQISQPSPFDLQAVVFFVPKRVYRDNQLRHNQYLDELIARVSSDETQFDPDRPTPSGPEDVEGFDRYYFFLCNLSVPVLSNVARRFVHLQTQLDEVRLAIALERWRLARGAYPETLAELVPDFIGAVPVDTYSRQPMIYRRKDGGTFFLYGVGQNRTDDGGKVDPERDDIWPYAPPPAL